MIKIKDKYLIKEYKGHKIEDRDTIKPNDSDIQREYSTNLHDKRYAEHIKQVAEDKKYVDDDYRDKVIRKNLLKHKQGWY